MAQEYYDDALPEELLDSKFPEFWSEAADKEGQSRLVSEWAEWFKQGGSSEIAALLLSEDPHNVEGHPQELLQEYLNSLQNDVASSLSCEERSSQGDQQSCCHHSPDAERSQNTGSESEHGLQIAGPGYAETGYKVVSGLVLKCVQAAAANDSKRAYKLINTIREQACRDGSGDQRLAHYFAEALVARITGTGCMLYRALSATRRPIDDFFSLFRVFAEVSPTFGLPVFFTNQTILDETAAATRVHIIDYGIAHGFRWLCLIRDFSERPGGPPKLRITGVDFPHHYLSVPAEDVGQKLATYASQVRVPFEFNVVVSTQWDLILLSELGVRPEDKDEVLVVSCIYKLRFLSSEVSPSTGWSPREQFLANIHRMQPKVFVHAAFSASCNSRRFVKRVEEALAYYSAVFDSMDQTVPKGSSHRLLGEFLHGLDILNLVACEGEDQNQRLESHKKWQKVIQKAGFQQQALRPHIYHKAREMIQTYHSGFQISREGNWLLISWKNQIQDAMCTWKPR